MFVLVPRPPHCNSPEKHIELRSDTFTKPTPGMRQAMMAADVGDDCYKEDKTVARLESTVASKYIVS